MNSAGIGPAEQVTRIDGKRFNLHDYSSADGRLDDIALHKIVGIEQSR